MVQQTFRPYRSFHAVGKIAVAAFAAAVLIALLAVSAHAQRQLSSQDALTLSNQVGILVVVNDHPITDVDLAYRINLELLISETPNTVENRSAFTAQAFDNLILDRIKIQAGESAGLRIGDAQIRSGVVDIARRNRQSADEFLASLAQGGVPENVFFDNLRAQFAWTALVSSRVDAQARVSETDLNAELARINSLRGRSERLMSEIFLPYSQYEPQQALDTAGFILAQLRSGQEGVRFSDLARQYSFSPRGAVGGNLGWVVEGALDPAIEQRLASLFTGQVTDPAIVTDEGVYIFGIQRTRPIGAANSRTLVRLSQLFRNIPQNQQSYEAQQDFLILNQATVKTENCREFETYINTFGDVGSGDMGVIDLSTLGPQLSQVLATLEIGEPSPVLPVPNGGAVFMVCDRTQDIDEETREQVERRLIAQRRSALELRYENDLKRQAIIDYRF